MAYVQVQEGTILEVTAQFVQSCGLLRDMADVFGTNTPDDPVPLPTVPLMQLQQIMDFDKQFCDPNTNNNLNEYLRAFTAAECLVLWRLTDFLDHALFERALVNHMADLIRFAEPARVMEMFNIQQTPTDDELNAALHQYPFLQEV
jgi:hypothetical protein